MDTEVLADPAAEAPHGLAKHCNDRDRRTGQDLAPFPPAGSTRTWSASDSRERSESQIRKRAHQPGNAQDFVQPAPFGDERRGADHEHDGNVDQLLRRNWP